MTNDEAMTKAKELFGEHGSAWISHPPGSPMFCIGLRIPLDRLGNRFRFEVKGCGDNFEEAFKVAEPGSEG